MIENDYHLKLQPLQFIFSKITIIFPYPVLMSGSIVILHHCPQKLYKTVVRKTWRNNAT